VSMHPRLARNSRGVVVAVGTGALAVVVAAALGTSPAVASSKPGPLRHARTPHTLPAGLKSVGSLGLGTQRSATEKVDGSLRSAKGQVDVMLELESEPASTAFAAARSQGLAAARAAARLQGSVVKRSQAAVEAHFGASATRAQALYRASSVYSGVAVRTDATRLAALAELPGVKAVHRIVPKSLDNSSSVPLIGAPAVWKGRGQTGQGVRVGVIDTGIDYTHADFGGPGTAAAFKAAKAATTFDGTTKVVGGHDFVGDAYDPSGGNANPVPDDNPLDCEGHGSHVAGTTAGLGVTKDGATWTDGYAADIDPASLSIGPGVAPGASLYALKVFGCEGDTSMVGAALQWAADPNGDGDPSDHLDVVNMSLGGDYGSPDDPDAVASDNLAALGTVVVASMGNAGDVYEVGGAPGNARRVVGVAASDDGNDVVDGLKVDSPAGIEPAATIDGKQDNVFAALKSVAYDWAGKAGVTATQVVTLGDWSQPATDTNNTDACTALSPADAAKVAGKVVMTQWFDGNGRRCGSAGRSAIARTAGAVGVIFGSDVNSFSAGVTGDTDIPAMLTVNQATTAIKAQLDAGTPVTVTMTNALRNSVVVVNKGAVDQVASFSSRGVGVAGGVKPDVAAPGVTTFSVAVGTGNEGIAESGTSMASPHVAGEAALVRGAHTGWSVEEVKAAIMNTATQDVFVGPNHTGAVYGPERVGSGRVRADAAVDTQTLAFVLDDPGAVSVSFGPVAVTAEKTVLTKKVRIENKRLLTSASYTLEYKPAHASPGVTYSVNPSQVTIPKGRSLDVTVTATITRSQLTAVADPTVDTDPLGLGVERSRRTDASGRMVLTPATGTSGGQVRVPVWSAPRPATAMKAAESTVVGGSGAVQTSTIGLSGLGVDNGSVDQGTAYLGTVSTLQLQGTSGRLPACAPGQVSGCTAFADDRSADLRYVGSASDAPMWSSLDDAMVTFGVSSYGPWRTPSSYTEFDVFLDSNADGRADAAVYNTRVRTTDDFDYLIAETVDLRPGDNQFNVIDQELLNFADGSFDTNLFNSDSLVMPVWVKTLRDAGLVTSGASKLRYWVESYTSEAGHVDAVGSASAPMTLTVGSPGMAAYGGFGTVLNDDAPGATLLVRRDNTANVTDRARGLLLIHHLNTNGARAQVVAVKAATATRLSANDADYRYGGRPVLTATVAPSTVTGTVTFREGTRILGHATTTSGRAALQVPVLARGTHRVTATYNGTGAYAPSTSAALTLTVR